jgi:hypothetical protein
MLLNDVKSACVYESLNDDMPKRSLSEHISIINDTTAQMIFRSSWRWRYLPISCSDLPLQYQQKCIDAGYSFEQKLQFNQGLLATFPDLIIVGAIPAQKIDKTIEINEYTGEIFNATQLYSMIFNPLDWNIQGTKEQWQTVLAQYTDGYYPDITNPVVQNLILGWCKKLIDSGSSAVWIDLLYTQASKLLQITNNANHPAVIASYNAASELIDNIHNYGTILGKNIYVGTWLLPVSIFITDYGMVAPSLDFVTASPSPVEVLNKTFDIPNWDTIINSYNSAFGGAIPFFTFIDWSSNDSSQMANFSQRLTTNEQSIFLTDATTFFKNRGIIFIYPVHGGVMGPNATKLSFGQYTRYDSLAPELNTYETIKQLMKVAGASDICLWVASKGEATNLAVFDIMTLVSAYLGQADVGFPVTIAYIMGSVAYYLGKVQSGDSLTGCAFASNNH